MQLSEIVRALGVVAHRFDIDLLDCCDSTNAELLARAESGAPSGSVVVTQTQTAGRGRRGRRWISAAGDSLTFSLLWRFASGTVPVGLSLAVGLAVAQALEKAGAGNVKLKWPNDLLLEGKKLGGILVELVPGAPHSAVIGIGINLRLPDVMPDTLKAQSAALTSSWQLASPALLAGILTTLREVLEQFAAGGFARLRSGWLARHAHQDQPVSLLSDFATPRRGVCRGVDTDGALLFEINGQTERVLSGEISLRGAA